MADLASKEKTDAQWVLDNLGAGPLETLLASNNSHCVRFGRSRSRQGRTVSVGLRVLLAERYVGRVWRRVQRECEKRYLLSMGLMSAFHPKATFFTNQRYRRRTAALLRCPACRRCLRNSRSLGQPVQAHRNGPAHCVRVQRDGLAGGHAFGEREFHIRESLGLLLGGDLGQDSWSARCGSCRTTHSPNTAMTPDAVSIA